MSENLIFDSLDTRVPPVRRDVQIIPLQHNGEDILYFLDELGYASPNFALQSRAEPILSLINGQLNIEQISSVVGGTIGQQELLDFIQLLDENCVLESAYYQHVARSKEESFELSPLRASALAGNSYPDDPVELDKYLNDIFDQTNPPNPAKSSEKALYAPHIDPRVGQKVYANAFSTIKDLKPRRVVILATAHYTGYYPGLYENIPFVGSRKSFKLPHGLIHTDKHYLDNLEEADAGFGFTSQDRAHRIEHSIELHLLFARHVWKHDFSIVPILVNSFDQLYYMPEGHLHQAINRFTSVLKELDDEDTFYLISGDLAHVGKKFGDTAPAASIRSQVERFDEHFLKFATDNNQSELIAHIRQEYDCYRICGFPPLYTFLKTFPNKTGELVDYSWWDEAERESAVSFGAISY